MKRLGAALAALALTAGCKAAPAPATPDDSAKPRLMLLTSLPILFGEQFTLDAPDSPLRAALEKEFSVAPIALAEAAQLGKGGLLLMAQPRAQTAEALVDLDAWVRGGGRLLLLADPKLDWPSDLPLGDRLAPMPQFADTGLTKHWGLILYQPEAGGPSVGSFDRLDGTTCTLEAERSVARCPLGKGEAVVIADADFARDAAGAARVVGELQRLGAR